jgi:hypothetical protein
MEDIIGFIIYKILFSITWLFMWILNVIREEYQLYKNRHKSRQLVR